MSDFEPLDPSPDDLWEGRFEGRQAERNLERNYDSHISQQFEEYVREQTTCPTCKGRRTIIEPTTGEEEAYDCPDCGGSGRAEDALSLDDDPVFGLG